MVTGGLGAVAGRKNEDITVEGYPYSQMRPGCYDPVERLKDMDEAGVLASINFPSFPRFCGQVFWEAKDKDLALLCVKAYNDWMIDEWCGADPGRLIPLTIIPLWDPQEAVKEIERTAAKGSNSFCFSENFEPLGLPTIHDPSGYWDPVLSRPHRTVSRCSRSTSARRRQVYKVAPSNSPFIANILHGLHPAGRSHAVVDLRWHVSKIPQDQDRPVEELDRAGSLGSWSGPSRCTRPRATGCPRASSSRARPRVPTPSWTTEWTCGPSMSTGTTASTSTGASSTTPPGWACSTWSARTTSWSRWTTPTRTPPGHIP